MNVSSVKNLNGETFSAVQDADLTTVVQTNSASWGQGGGVTYSAGEYIDITDDTISVTGVTDLVAGNAITITTSGTSAIISSNGEAQVQSDWDVTDSNSKAYIKNKPTIPAAQIQSDWNQTNTNAKDYIKNKPIIPSYTGASGINVSSNIVSLDNPIGLIAGDNITITVSGTSAILSANAGGGGGSTSGLVSGTNFVKKPYGEGDDDGDYWSACISGDVKVATGDYDEDGLYEHNVYSLSAIGSDIGNKLNKNTIENSKTIRILNNNTYEVFDFAYKRTNFTNGSANEINLDDDAHIYFDADDVVRSSNLYSASITAETTATGIIDSERGFWRLEDFSNGSAILTATYLAGIRDDMINLFTWDGWGPITNCEATCTVYTSAELAPLAYKDDIPSVPGYNETVLWEGNCTGVSSVNLSEPLTNFEYGKVIYCPYTANNQVPYKIHEFVPDDSRLIISLSNFNTDFKLNIFKTRFSASNTTFYSLSNAYFDGTWTSANHNNFLGMYKVIGINRKENA